MTFSKERAQRIQDIYTSCEHLLEHNLFQQMDQFIELNPGSGDVISTGIDLTGDEVSDVVYTPDGDIQMADLNEDGVSTQEEMVLTQAAIDYL
jgi:hypothetical protein